MAPKEWTSTRLGNIFRSRREKGKDGLPTMSVTLNDGLVERSSLDRKTDSTLLAEEHLAVKPGDIAYNMMRMWQGASGLSEREGLVSPAYVVLKPSKTVCPKFIAYLFKTPRMIHSFWAYSYGLTNDRLRLYFKDFSAIPVVLPTLNEQMRIAEILATWDRAIEITKRLISNSEAQKAALLQRVLSPIVKNARRDSSWRHVALEELGDFFSGVTYSPEDVTTSEKGLLVLRSSNIQNGLITFEDNVYVRADTKASTYTQAGDVLICVRNGSRSLIGKTAAITPRSAGLAHGAFMSLFRPRAHAEFCRQLFVTSKFEKLVSQNLGATINSINTSDMRQFSFLLPPKSQWKRIGEMLSLQDQNTEGLRSQLLNLRCQQQALTQQLLTGKRRVKIDKEIAA